MVNFVLSFLEWKKDSKPFGVSHFSSRKRAYLMGKMDSSTLSSGSWRRGVTDAYKAHNLMVLGSIPSSAKILLEGNLMGNYEVTLLPAQRKFIEIPDDIEPMTQYFSLYQGGYGSGKTWAGSLKGLLIALKYPKSEGMVGASTYALLSQTTLKQYFKHLDNMGYHYVWNEKKQTLTLQNGSTILFKHFENPEDLKSINVHWIEIEEMSQLSQASFDELMARCRLNPLPEWKEKRWIWQIFGHSNPQSAKGWIYEYFKKNTKSNFRRIIAPTTENYHLPKDFVQNLKDVYSEEYFAINVLGQDDNSTTSLAVKGFNPDVQVDETIKINPQYPLHLTCDFNIDPMCWYLCQDYGDMTYILYEFVIEDTDTLRAAHIVCDTLQPYKNAQIIINGDSSGRSRTTKGSDYDIMRNVFAQEGFFNHRLELLNKNPSIEWRIQQFNAWMQDSQGKHHIKVHPQCKWLIHNFENVEIIEGTSKPKVPSTGALRADPKRKFLIHPIDAVSYLVCTYHRQKYVSEWAEYQSRDVGTDIFGGKYDKRLT